ncbi:oligopeptide ABC transporter ATP-binding protein [Williamsoniiplasma somnilux]|uniref:Oligopeptide ABC transporter ATP-binding protein n=1 Tax=Williamsoniiplasma somnilux TaxID=215578 RepID=A0A2K8P0B4_9MOLU|nr:ATP-binding cassette domain-containing protein [Williamsoniiplasma somnilux]ATZ18888.1 oligopeptide ABC transporter ATP-binding protein [Williamsoniiplasma somnilux]
MARKDAIIKVRDLLIEFGNGKKKIKAVKGVTFDVYKGETFGLVGESGSGKTTVGRAVMGIQPLSDGAIYFKNRMAYGMSPDLFKLNIAILKNLDKMKSNQDTTTLRLNTYLEEFKRVDYKYTQSKYYDFKTKTLKEYPDGVSRIIPEGVNLKKTKLVTHKKDANLSFVKVAVKDNLKSLLKILRIQQKTLRFIDSISDWIDIDKELDLAINKYQKETYNLVAGIKELENKIWNALEKMSKIKQDVIEGKSNSVSKFFNDLGTELKEIITLHKSISTLIKMAENEQFINIALTSPSRLRNKYKNQIEQKIQKHKNQNNILMAEKYQNILELMNLKNIQEQIKKSEIFEMPNAKRQRNLKKEMQMIFQDPASSLNERMAIEQIIAEGLDNFPELYKNEDAANAYMEWFNSNEDAKAGTIKRSDVKWKDVKHFLVLQLLTTVGMLPEHLSRYPHEFSGGQRQRIGIARALVMKPSFIVADEPISALDVSIRAQVMNLLAKFQQELDLTYIFIAHDLSVVRFVADRIAVIYRGDIVELAEADELFYNPLHPYTKSLLSAVPLPDPEQERKKVHYKYEPEIEHSDYLVDFPQWVEVKNGHFIYANERELKAYKKAYNEYEKNK